MSLMRAKMKVSRVEAFKNAEQTATISERLYFGAVCKNGSYPTDGKDEDNSFALWTPNAEMSMTVNNPELFGKFTAGQTFYVDFTEAT